MQFLASPHFWIELVVGILVAAGCLIALLGSLGLVRMQRYFDRVHSPSIIATMACWLIMWATVIYFSFTGEGLATHALLIAVFVATTAPITSIFLMRAALFKSRTSGASTDEVPAQLSLMVVSDPLDDSQEVAESMPAYTASTAITATGPSHAIQPTEGDRHVHAS